jgi:hypothetical protein
MVKPPDPFQCCELHVLVAAPRSFSVDYLRFEEADDGLGEGIVVRIAAAADRRFDAGLRQGTGNSNHFWRPPERCSWCGSASTILAEESKTGGETRWRVSRPVPSDNALGPESLPVAAWAGKPERDLRT